MFYIIIPKSVGDVPESWYAYLLKVGSVTVYENKPETTEQSQVVRFICHRQVVHLLDNSFVFDKKCMTLNFACFLFDQLQFELCEKSESSSLTRLTTNFFYHYAWRLRFNYSDQSVNIGGETYYLLCSGLFKSPPVSISRKPQNREILFYNENTKVLIECYQNLCASELRNNQAELNYNLDCLAKFVRTIFQSSDLAMVQAVIADKDNNIIEIEGATPNIATAVSLDKFISAKVGVCRHHSMLVCYLLQRMKIDGFVPEAEVIHYRMVMPNGIGHTFVLYRTENHHEIYVVDSTVSRVFCLPSMRARFTRYYGDEIYGTLSERYLVIEICEPTLPIMDDEIVFTFSNSKL